MLSAPDLKKVVRAQPIVVINRAQVAIGRIRQNGDDPGRTVDLTRQLEAGPDCGAARPSREHTFFVGEIAGCAESFLVSDLVHVIDQAEIDAADEELIAQSL